MRILIIDDDVEFLEEAKKEFEYRGYEVTIANNGERGLELGIRFGYQYDIILLDICMSKITGFDILKIIRNITNKLLIFMITKYSNEEFKKKAKEYNANGYILKNNINWEEEIKIITEMIQINNKYK